MVERLPPADGSPVGKAARHPPVGRSSRVGGGRGVARRDVLTKRGPSRVCRPWPSGIDESGQIPPRPQEDTLKKYLPLALAGLVGATMIAPSLAGATTTSNVAYDSTPVKGTVSVPSVGAESSAFNQLGNEVILRPHSTIGHVKVTMVSFACQSGNWATGCTSAPGATFKAPITLNLYRYSKSNPTTGEIKPRRLIKSVTKTFSIHYRPSSQSPSESRYLGKDNALHNGIAQTISFPVQPRPGHRRGVDGRLRHGHQWAAPAGRRLPDERPERRSVARRADRSRPLPRLDHVGHAGCQTRPMAPRSCRASSTWTRVGPATCLLRASPFADENLPHRGGSAGHGRPALMSQATSTRTCPASARSKAGLVPSRPWLNWHPRRSI